MNTATKPLHSCRALLLRPGGDFAYLRRCCRWAALGLLGMALPLALFSRLPLHLAQNTAMAAAALWLFGRFGGWILRPPRAGELQLYPTRIRFCGRGSAGFELPLEDLLAIKYQAPMLHLRAVGSGDRQLRCRGAAGEDFFDELRSALREAELQPTSYEPRPLAR